MFTLIKRFLNLLPKADDETSDLIDSYNGRRGSCRNYLTNMVLKGPKFARDYMEAIDRFDSTRHLLLKKLEKTGPVVYDGTVWSVKKVKNQEIN